MPPAVMAPIFGAVMASVLGSGLSMMGSSMANGGEAPSGSNVLMGMLGAPALAGLTAGIAPMLSTGLTGVTGGSSAAALPSGLAAQAPSLGDFAGQLATQFGSVAPGMIANNAALPGAALDIMSGMGSSVGGAGTQAPVPSMWESAMRPGATAPTSVPKAPVDTQSALVTGSPSRVAATPPTTPQVSSVDKLSSMQPQQSSLGGYSDRIASQASATATTPPPTPPPTTTITGASGAPAGIDPAIWKLIQQRYNPSVGSMLKNALFTKAIPGVLGGLAQSLTKPPDRWGQHQDTLSPRPGARELYDKLRANRMRRLAMGSAMSKSRVIK